ncbi:MAG: MFS transporter [Burkholderiales bacterium]|nr:MFS transporter [Burkholderiales bacterium]
MAIKKITGNPVGLIAWVCLAHVASMLCYAIYPTLLPQLQLEWGASNSAAGLISGMFFAGYMASVPVLSGLTDRIDARRVYLFSSLLAAIGCLGFALFAQGVWTAALFQGITGAGIAGTYMPGLRAHTDNLADKAQGRAVSFYTAVFGVGASFSILLAGGISAALDWRWAFGLCALGPLAAGLMILTALPHRRPPAAGPRALLDLRPVLANRAVRGYIFGYTVHCWELFGSRSWMVAFFVFSQSLSGGGLWPWSPVLIAALANLFGPGASVLGNELAMRYGRNRVVPVIMVCSGLCSCLFGMSSGMPWYAIVVLALVMLSLHMGDSSALTTGMVANSDPTMRGASMALHSMLGFGAGFIAPLAFGAVLDAGGGNASPEAWMLAYASLGVIGVFAPLILKLR